METNETCFYCNHEIDGRPYMVHFFKGNEEQEQQLCDVCYADWLAGIRE